MRTTLRCRLFGHRFGPPTYERGTYNDASGNGFFGNMFWTGGAGIPPLGWFGIEVWGKPVLKGNIVVYGPNVTIPDDLPVGRLVVRAEYPCARGCGVRHFTIDARTSEPVRSPGVPSI